MRKFTEKKAEVMLGSVVGEKVSYYPTTGTFRRKRDGIKLGTMHRDGYVQLKLNGKFVLAHRLAWFMAHGEWPQGNMRHKNGDRADNRLKNLEVI